MLISTYSVKKGEVLMDVSAFPTNAVLSKDEWLKARLELLALEKEETRLRDKVRAARRALPWVRVDKDYVFDTPEGGKTLSDLFAGRSQLLIYHFMFGPDWSEGCVGCSFMADHFDGTLAHLNHHDVPAAAVVCVIPVTVVEAQVDASDARQAARGQVDAC
jgi:predicted dithiol-disulfide oxidoreductase (DUF899 family)